jgi:hypothetical protein
MVVSDKLNWELTTRQVLEGNYVPTQRTLRPLFAVPFSTQRRDFVC